MKRAGLAVTTVLRVVGISCQHHRVNSRRPSVKATSHGTVFVLLVITPTAFQQAMTEEEDSSPSRVSATIDELDGSSTGSVPIEELLSSPQAAKRNMDPIATAWLQGDLKFFKVIQPPL